MLFYSYRYFVTNIYNLILLYNFFSLIVLYKLEKVKKLVKGMEFLQELNKSQKREEEHLKTNSINFNSQFQKSRILPSNLDFNRESLSLATSISNAIMVFCPKLLLKRWH